MEGSAIEHLYFVNCLSGLNYGNVVVILSDIGESAWRVSWIDGWVSSNGQAGIVADGFSNGSITLDDIQIDDNGTNGVRAIQASDVSVISCKLMGNSGSAASVCPAIELGTPDGGTVNGAIIQGSRAGIGAGFGNPMSWGTFIHATRSRLVIRDNDFAGIALGGVNTTVASHSILMDNLLW